MVYVMLAVSQKLRKTQLTGSNEEQLKELCDKLGWNALQYTAANRHWDQSILGKTEEGESFYFVHSFMAEPENSEDILAQCLYEELPITAVVKKDNITGCQFHPEKSGPSGLKILEQFVS